MNLNRVITGIEGKEWHRDEYSSIEGFNLSHLCRLRIKFDDELSPYGYILFKMDYCACCERYGINVPEDILDFIGSTINSISFVKENIGLPIAYEDTCCCKTSGKCSQHVLSITIETDMKPLHIRMHNYHNGSEPERAELCLVDSDWRMDSVKTVFEDSI